MGEDRDPAAVPVDRAQARVSCVTVSVAVVAVATDPVMRDPTAGRIVAVPVIGAVTDIAALAMTMDVGIRADTAAAADHATDPQGMAVRSVRSVAAVTTMTVAAVRTVTTAVVTVRTLRAMMAATAVGVRDGRRSPGVPTRPQEPVGTVVQAAAAVSADSEARGSRRILRRPSGRGE